MAFAFGVDLVTPFLQGLLSILIWEDKNYMFLNRGFVPHGLVKSNTGWRDWAPPGWLRSQRLAAVFLRSLLTVTPSADLHHIAEHFELFPADQAPSQNNRHGYRQSLLDASSALLKCFSQHLDPSLQTNNTHFSLLRFATLFDILVYRLWITFDSINWKTHIMQEWPAMVLSTQVWQPRTAELQ